jgi:hypothetical protein
VFGAVVDLTGMITFEADGAFAANTNTDAQIVITIPKSCLMGAQCIDIGDEENPAVDTGDACELTQASVTMKEETGTYEIDGNTVITTDDADMMPGEPISFCVRGDTLTASSTDDDGAVTVFQATRQ